MEGGLGRELRIKIKDGNPEIKPRWETKEGIQGRKRMLE
jgi:hypothetical protein